MALFLVALASLAALYDSKILIWDIALADLRIHSGGWGTVIVAVVVSAGFVALPLVVGLRWALKGRPTAAMLISAGSLALSVVGFVVLSAAFTP